MEKMASILLVSGHWLGQKIHSRYLAQQIQDSREERSFQKNVEKVTKEVENQTGDSFPGIRL